MNTRKKVLLLCMLCTSGEASQDKYAANFLDMGVGAKASGLGMAFTGVSDDGTAFYWNPAGFSLLGKTCISAMVAPQFGFRDALAELYLLGIYSPIDRNAGISMNWLRLYIGDIPVYPELEGSSYTQRLHDNSLRPSATPQSYLHFITDAFYFSFSRVHRLEIDLGWQFHRVGMDISYGTNIKVLRCVMGNYRASGIGLDIGMMMRIHLDDFFQIERFGTLVLAVNGMDVTSTRLSWNTRYAESRPGHFRTGLSFIKPLPGKGGRFLFSLDREMLYDSYSMGMEYGFYAFSLRLGIYDRHLTCGTGLRIKNLQLDYALLLHELGPSHRINCTWILSPLTSD